MDPNAENPQSGRGEDGGGAVVASPASRQDGGESRGEVQEGFGELPASDFTSAFDPAPEPSSDPSFRPSEADDEELVPLELDAAGSESRDALPLKPTGGAADVEGAPRPTANGGEPPQPAEHATAPEEPAFAFAAVPIDALSLSAGRRTGGSPRGNTRPRALDDDADVGPFLDPPSKPAPPAVTASIPTDTPTDEGAAAPSGDIQVGPADPGLDHSYQSHLFDENSDAAVGSPADGSSIETSAEPPAGARVEPAPPTPAVVAAPNSAFAREPVAPTPPSADAPAPPDPEPAAVSPDELEPTDSVDPAPAPKRRASRRERKPQAPDGPQPGPAPEPRGSGDDNSDDNEAPDALLDYESSAAPDCGADPDELDGDGNPIASGGGGWTIPLLCAGLGILACCLLIPLCDANRRAAYERLRLRQDLESLQRQVATNDEFLHKVADDPTLAERLAQRQMHKIRAGTRVLPLHDYGGYADSGDESGDAAGAYSASMSPFRIVAVPPPGPLPPYRPLCGRIAALCYNPHSRLYLMGCGLILLAAGLVLGYSPLRGKLDASNPKTETSSMPEEEMTGTAGG